MAINVEVCVTCCFGKATLFDVDCVQCARVLDGDIVGSDADDGSVSGVKAVKIRCFGAYVGVVVEWEGG